MTGARMAAAANAFRNVFLMSALPFRRILYSLQLPTETDQGAAMPRFMTAAVLFACAVSIPVVSGFSRTFADEGRAPRNAAEFDTLFQQVKNWGRWGKDDQLGSANLVTAAKRKQAVALVKDGTTVSLAHNVLTEKAEDVSSPF